MQGYLADNNEDISCYRQGNWCRHVVYVIGIDECKTQALHTHKDDKERYTTGIKELTGATPDLEREPHFPYTAWVGVQKVPKEEGFEVRLEDLCGKLLSQ